ncbi:glycine-rich protein [Kitasatospora misakiensis]|uniref:Glycine-rich protein n=1 Tax=Kitasatospora misakiensis TaxID=67330 RepID=A0ABW0X9M6_9ACTN
MAPVRSLLGGRFSTAVRGALALLCLVPQGGLALAAAPPAYGPQGLPERQRALVACTPTSGFTNCARVTYSGGDQTFTVPAGVTSVYARVFGAGGAGAPRAYYTGQYGGGGGGYTTGAIAVTPGQTLTLTVGQGGRMNSTTSTYGGGGAGGQGFTTPVGASATGGSGGGMSAVWNGTSGTDPLLVAGGGGGASPGADATTPAAGGGGGTTGGQDNQAAASGRGGTQTAGGAGAAQTACATAGDGSQYQGGSGASAPQFEGGGGGGGGYYGGGGGACQRGGRLEPNGMGGGGSGYNRGAGVTDTQTSNGTNSTGNGVGGTSGGRTDALYTSGIGDGGGYSDGGNGEIVLEWVTQVGLSITKSAAPTTYVPGRPLTYTFVVRNAGPAPAVDAAVRDALPSALSGFTWTCASGGTGSSCGTASGTGNIDTTATIAVNSSVTYTVTGTVPAATTGTLANTATVTRPTASTDPNCGPTCSSTVETPGRVTTGLSVTKTPDKNPYVPGQPLTYTIVVKNDGPSDAAGTSVRDTLPAAVQNFTWSCTASGGSSCGATPSGTGNIDTTVTILAGGQVTYRLTGTVPADATGSLDNRATVTPPGGTTDPNCSPSCTSTANPIPPGNQANLVVSKTLLTSPVVPGAQIRWRVTVTNNGPSRARNVVVTDRIPAGVTGASMVNDQDGGSCPIANGTASCPAVEIPLNGTASWTLTGTLDPNATSTPTNTAVVTGGPDPATPTHTAVASPTNSPSPQANLTISKTLLTSPVVPGAQIQWRVTVANNGPSRARNVVVTDTVPSGVTGASMKADAGGTDCPISGSTATCPAVEIPAGSSLSWTLTGTLDPNATSTPTNTAVVTGGPDPAATARTAVASPTALPSPQANLTVSKSLLTSPAVPGQAVQWRVTVSNNGPSRARNVVVTDTVPSGVTGASMKADADGADCPIGGGVATCPAVEIPAGSSLSWTLTGTLDPNATTTPTNSVTVTGGPDPSASSHTAVASPTNSPSPQANLTVSKVLLTNPVVPGQQIQWRVTVTNNGPSRARDVVVTDTVPTGVNNATMTADASGANCPITNSTATCPAVEIPAGSSATWTLTGTLSSDATATPANTATVTGGPDPATPTHTAVASPTNSPAPQANLTVSKVLLTNPVVPGQQIQWRVTVTNNGPSRARDVVVTDTVPAGVNNPSMQADADGANCPINGGTATCPAVEIPAGSSATWTLTGTLSSDATSTPTNTVTVTGGPDPATPTHTAVASPTNSPAPQANLAVSKVLLTNPVVPGQQIQWRVTVTNNGPSRARDVVVTDQIPAQVNNATMTADADGANCPINAGTATCPAVEIPAGSSATWTLTGTLDANATTTPTNTVTVTGGPDPATPTHTAVASPTNSPAPQANLTVSKVLLTNPVVPGQQVQWRVSVTNNGPSRARDVVVTDQVPAEVNNATMTADTDGANCPINGGTATCPAVEIPAGQTLTWTLTGTLDANATTTPTNTVTVTGGPDPATPTHTAVASPTNSPTPQTNLTVSKSLLTNPVVPGQAVQWRVTVTNNGPSRARDVVVTDQVPAQVNNATMTADADGANCPINGGTATCPAVEISAGQTLTWTLSGTLASDATSTPTNTVTVTGGPDPATPTHTTVASPTNSPTPQANLTVSKSLLTNPVVPGQQIQWRVIVTNNGPSRARDVVVTDQVPAGLNNPSMQADADGVNCPINGGTATCPAIEIPAGQTLTWTLTGTLDTNATTTPTNTVVVTGGPDPTATAHTAVASPTSSPSAQASLTVSKVLLTDPVVPGQQIQWRVSVTNNGPSRARNVVVTDQVPAGVNNATMTADADGANCPIGNGTATCPAVEIPVGQTLTWTLSGTLDANATTTPTNTVTATGGPDPATPTHTAVASPSNSPAPQANLTVSKVLLTNPVFPGQQIQWRVTVTNNGPSRARDVVVTDQVPAGVNNATMTADADGTNCPIANGTATCPAVEIPVGQAATWTLSGTLDANATTTPTNTVTATGGPDPATPTHTAVASPTTTPTPQANLTVSKVLLTNPVVPGQQIQWRVSVTNNGPSRARDVVVTDQVPAGVNNATMTADADGTNCPIANGTATCPAVEIPVGQSLAWTLTGTLAQDATVTPTNTALVTGGPDPSTPTHTAVASPTNSPTPQASLTVSKVLLTNPVVPGQQIQWRVSVTNNGPSQARNVVVTDRVPDGVGGASMTSADGSVCPITDGTAVCPAVDLEVGRTQSYTLSGTLVQDATVTPTNTVTVTGGPDPSTPTHTAVASPTDSPSPQARLTVAKALLTDPVVPGEIIQWRVTVTNNGPSTARDVVVADRIPDGVSGAVLQSDVDATVCPVTGGVAVCPAVELAVGRTVSYTLTATLAPDATVTPTNTVTVTGGPDPATPTHTAVASPTASPTPQANLGIAKALVTNPVVPGQRIQWRVTVTNRGPSRARNVVVTDTVPALVDGASMTSDADGSACPITGGTATCPAVEIPAGGSVSYTVTGTLDPAATGTPVNVATVTGGPDPATPTHTATAQASETVAPRASLTVSKALLTDPVVPGQSIAWRISVTNNGPSLARNVVVADRIPDGVVGASLSPDETGAACPVAGGVATCPAIEIPVGRTATYTLSGTLAQDATAVPGNTAVVTGGPDPSTSAHTAVASPTGSPSPQARLTVSKALVTDPVVPGGTVRWRVTVLNNGPSRARNVVVTDRVPDGVSGAVMASDEDGTDCPVTGGVATCPAIDLEVGQTASYTLSGTLAQDATVTPTNTVVVTGGPDPGTPTHTAVASPTGSPSPQARLTVSKALVTDPVVPGGTVRWRVTVLNNGPSRARNVVVTDRVPDGVSGAVMASDEDGTDCPVTGGVASCPAIDLEVGQTASYTLSGTLAQDATVTPTNTVVVTGGPDPGTPTHTAVASPTGSPSPQANLVVAKALVTDPVIPGRQIQWRVTVTNNGPSRARNVVVTDRVPAGVSDASMTAPDGTACAIAGGTATCPAVEIAVGRTLTWTLSGTLDPGATVTPTNTALVTGGPDPSASTHTAVASPSVEPVREARLSVSKVLLTDPVVPGQQIRWQVVVTNRGPSVARDVVVTDRIPGGVLNASMAADDGTACPIADRTATCPAVGIPVGGTRVWTLTGTLDAGATVTPANTATVTGGPDPATPTHTAVASPSEPPSGQARLSVAKALLTSPVVAGQQIRWRVTVTNHGPSPARNVVVTDRVPAGVGDASMTGDTDGAPCPIADGTATCPAVGIPVGATASWTLTGTLDPDATAVPVNTVVVTGGPDPDATAHTAVATPTEPITVRHDLLLTKHASPADPKAGDQVTYTVTATNRASGTYVGAVVTDDLSAVLDGAVYGRDADASTGRTAYAAPRLTWTLDIRPGATETLSYTVTVKPDAGGARLVNRLTADGSNCSGSTGGNGPRRAEAGTSDGNCSTTTTVRHLPSPSPSPTTRPPLPPTGSGSPKPALLITVVFLALGGLLVAARRSRR